MEMCEFGFSVYLYCMLGYALFEECSLPRPLLVLLKERPN